MEHLPTPEAQHFHYATDGVHLWIYAVKRQAGKETYELLLPKQRLTHAGAHDHARPPDATSPQPVP